MTSLYNFPHGKSTLDRDCKAYLEGVIQVWIHRPDSRLASRQKQSVAARHLLKLALAAVNISLTDGTLALPGINLIQAVREQSGAEISITHCPEIVAVAIGRGKLGLDCEVLGSRKRNWQGIADQFFTEREADAIRQANSEMTEHAFLLHWTLKEAFVKANEMSIFGALNHLIVRSSTEVRLEGCGQGHWQAWHAELGNCMLGICFQEERIVSPVVLECTDLFSEAFTTCKDITPINFVFTS